MADDSSLLKPRSRTRRLALVLLACLVLAIALPNLTASAQGQAEQAAQGGPISAQAQQQIAALLVDKRTRTPAQRKIDSNLLWRIKQLRSEPITAQLPSLRADVQPALGGLVEVDIQADIDDALLAQIRALGGTVESAFPQYRAVRARIPLVQAERLPASLEDGEQCLQAWLLLRRRVLRSLPIVTGQIPDYPLMYAQNDQPKPHVLLE